MNLTGNIVTPGGIFRGVLRTEGERIAAIEPDDSVTGDALLIPGFIDVHCHGGDGATYTTGDAAQARKAAAFHLRHGTTTTLASLVSSPREVMVRAVEAFRPLVDEGVLHGIHFEGPYLSGARCGAQNPAALRDPDLGELAELVDAGAGAVKMMTIAPEREGAMEAISYLASRGVIASIGHTDASYEVTQDGVGAGARAATHTFNGMRPIGHRDPGPIPALFNAPGVICEFIVDPVHLHMGTVAFAVNAIGAGRIVAVTDAMSATGMADGEYDLGGLRVRVAEGAARLVEGGSIAGSTITMIDAFRNAVLGAGLTVPEAVQITATTPARLLGLDDRGVLAVGMRADVLELDTGMNLRGVVRGGSKV
ncbi:N-acetylglucosamine-6-phosphate deacetylase [Actinorhabdospora filicis]|uniref:N-acetylglucosamine-6-phosphate deacetylase n=1 Tax=Actinorhabdospora filicis TaxID=1785913 RepID=A0A9W6SM29_9ACTN|nr:N-acetylglucosamine-6-phosphate deacetylase [Actinorhabdospora filicis]GLZ77081.1 N-acetylglucosamine-6-phosphate deacetylase [Actinorhabdospora filicis]